MRHKPSWFASIVAGALLLSAVSALAGSGDEAPGAAGQEPAATGSPGSLDGATVYAWNCGSCHSERWPKERTDAEWDVIVTHMQVRANLTAEQAEAVLRFLQGSNG